MRSTVYNNVHRQVVQPTQLVPRPRRQPRGGIGMRIVQAYSASQKETPFIVTYFSFTFQQVDTQQEREQQLQYNDTIT